MVRRLPAWMILLTASCGGLGGNPPTSADFNPEGTAALEPAPGVEDAASREILENYAKKFSAGYPVFPGDELRFAVLGQADLSFDTRVPADGAIHYPLIGRLALAGRTLEEIRNEVRERLEKEYLVSAQVSVQVREYVRKRVYVLGAVAKPMEYEVPSAKFVTLLQAVAQAGGFAADASKHGVVIYRPKEIGSADRIAISVSAARVQEGRDRDPVVLPDDVIFVPARESVYVLGQVARPGALTVGADHGLTASQAISMAGGFTRIASESDVRLLRRAANGSRKTFVIDLARVVGGHPEEDVPLQPGDVLYVPESFF